MKYLVVILLLLSSCKSTEKCDAYTEEFDIHKEHKDDQKKYCSVEQIK